MGYVLQRSRCMIGHLGKRVSSHTPVPVPDWMADAFFKTKKPEDSQWRIAKGRLANTRAAQRRPRFPRDHERSQAFLERAFERIRSHDLGREIARGKSTRGAAEFKQRPVNTSHPVLPALFN